MANVKATREGRTKTFPARLWDIMPEHKYGWTISAPATLPTTVAENLGKVEVVKDKDSGEDVVRLKSPNVTFKPKAGADPVGVLALQKPKRGKKSK